MSEPKAEWERNQIDARRQGFLLLIAPKSKLEDFIRQSEVEKKSSVGLQASSFHKKAMQAIDDLAVSRCAVLLRTKKLKN